MYSLNVSTFKQFEKLSQSNMKNTHTPLTVPNHALLDIVHPSHVQLQCFQHPHKIFYTNTACAPDKRI